MKNILIIGSKGFIGSHCMDYFSSGNSVFGCDIIPSKPNSKNYFQIKNNSDYKKIFSENKFDLVINASGSAGVGFSIQFPEKDFELNVSNVEMMLELIRVHQPACKFINMSSAAVYGNPESLPISENAVKIPLSDYGKNKLKAEELLKKYHNQFGISTCSLRVFSAYGPGLHKQLFWDIFLKAKDTKHIRLFGTGSESRDFIFVDDLIKAINVVADNGNFIGDAVNVSSGRETTIREVAELFLKNLGNGFQLQFTGEEKIGDPKNWKADIRLLESLGYKSEVEISEGIKRTVEDYRKQ